MKRILIFIFFSFSIVVAQENDNLSLPDKFQEKIKESVLDLSERMDLFFSGEEHLPEDYENKTYLKIYTGFLHNEHEGTEGIFRFKLNLRLKRTEKKLNLVVSNLVDKLTQRDLTEDEFILTQQEKEEQQSVALVYFFNPIKNLLKPTLTVGIRLPLKYYIRLKFEIPFKFLGLEFEPAQFFEYRHNGFIEKTRLYIDKKLSDRKLFRLQLERYKQDEDGSMRFLSKIGYYRLWDYSQGFSVSAGIFGQSLENPKILNHLIQFKFKKRFWKPWLFYEISPGWEFPEERGYKSSFFIRFWFEFFFGKESILEETGF